MYLEIEEAKTWMQYVRDHARDIRNVNLFVLPSFVTLPAAQHILTGSNVGWGAQNMHWDDRGAWTGEVSPLTLKELDVTYVEIGHSERREHFNETNETVQRKVLASLRHGFRPIVCIGEDERNAELAEITLTEQMESIFAQVPHEQWPDIVVAYEPVWAIGQKDPADIPYLTDRFAQLRAWIQNRNAKHAAQVPILYGGSVNLQTAEQLLSIPEVGGLFIGRAALDPEVFCKIASIAEAHNEG